MKSFYDKLMIILHDDILNSKAKIREIPAIFREIDTAFILSLHFESSRFEFGRAFRSSFSDMN